MSTDNFELTEGGISSDALVRRFTRSLLLALISVMVLGGAGLHISSRILAAEEEAVSQINIAGRQRMLSQRGALFAREYMATGAEEDRVAAREALDELLANHDQLLAHHNRAIAAGFFSELSPSLQAIYFKPPHELSRRLGQFVHGVESALSPAEGALIKRDKNEISARFLPAARNSLLDALNNVVLQLERESQQRVTQLIWLKWSMAVAMVIIAVIFIGFMVRPLTSRLLNQLQTAQLAASVDKLSGLYNRRSLELLAAQIISSSRRYNRNISCLMFDIDHFKKVNDTYGHDVGDQAITHVASILRGCCRSSDVVARVGGEEFVMLLTEASSTDAYHLAEKVRRTVANSPLKPKDQSQLSLTISGGLSQFSISDNQLSDVLSRADKALYYSKTSGRNKVTNFDEIPTVPRAEDDTKAALPSAPMPQMSWQI